MNLRFPSDVRFVHFGGIEAIYCGFLMIIDGCLVTVNAQPFLQILAMLEMGSSTRTSQRPVCNRRPTSSRALVVSIGLIGYWRGQRIPKRLPSSSLKQKF